MGYVDVVSLPATSVQPLVTWTSLPSGPSYVTDTQESRPEPGVGSSPSKVKVTGAVYQPSIGSRSGVPITLIGAVASRLILIVAWVMPSELVAVQEISTPDSSVSARTDSSGQGFAG